MSSLTPYWEAAQGRIIRAEINSSLKDWEYYIEYKCACLNNSCEIEKRDTEDIIGKLC